MKEKLIICPYCRSPNIQYDDRHAEAYCEDCGLIVIDYTGTKYRNITENIIISHYHYTLIE